MKLYTEEQVKELLSNMLLTTEQVKSIFQELTPIELPSDEDIFNKSIEIMEEWSGSGCKAEIDAHFIGAKWMRDKILNK